MISIVVAAYNEEQNLGRCLESLLAQTAPRDAYEIIVADDGSRDGTRRVAEGYGVRVVSQPNRGAGSARNLGAQHARGEVVLFIDADSTADPRWIEAMAAPFADPGISGASGEKKTRQKNLWAQYVQIEYDFKYDRMAAYAAIDFVDSSTAGYRRDLLLASGGFDTTLKEAEDVELSFRLAGRGCRLVLIRDAITFHTHPDSLAHYIRRKFHYARWRMVVYRRYPRKAASDQRTPRAQKLQPLLAYAFAPAVIGAWLVNGLVPGVALLAALFVATTWPFVAYSWSRSRRVALIVPCVVWLAAYASGAGAALGVVSRVASINLPDTSQS